jgi:hypothetical protein
MLDRAAGKRALQVTSLWAGQESCGEGKGPRSNEKTPHEGIYYSQANDLLYFFLLPKVMRISHKQGIHIFEWKKGPQFKRDAVGTRWVDTHGKSDVRIEPLVAHDLDSELVDVLGYVNHDSYLGGRHSHQLQHGMELGGRKEFHKGCIAKCTFTTTPNQIMCA